MLLNILFRIVHLYNLIFILQCYDKIQTKTVSSNNKVLLTGEKEIIEDQEHIV